MILRTPSCHLSQVAIKFHTFCIIKGAVSLVMINLHFCIYEKAKAQISHTATVQLMSSDVFAILIVHPLLSKTDIKRIVQFKYNPKIQVCSYPSWLHIPICVGLVGKPDERFSSFAAHIGDHVFSRRGPYNLRKRIWATPREDLSSKFAIYYDTNWAANLRPTVLQKQAHWSAVIALLNRKISHPYEYATFA